MCIDLNHPGGAVGYSFLCDGKKVVVLLDNEFTETQEQKLSIFCDNADLLFGMGCLQKKSWFQREVGDILQSNRPTNLQKNLMLKGQ